MNPNTFRFLIQQIRNMVFAFAGVLWLTLYVSGQMWNQGATLSSWYARTAIAFLYCTLLISPLYVVFPQLPYKPIAIKARKALGVSGFFFALLHGYTAFFDGLGGFQILPQLPFSYLLSLFAGIGALLILTVLAVTSFDYLIAKLGRWWKPIHRFLYLAAILIVVHGATISSQLITMFTWMVIIYALVFFLLMLESIRLDKVLMKKYNFTQYYVTWMAFPFVAVGVLWLFFFR